jgi:hypothetical protein
MGGCSILSSDKKKNGNPNKQGKEKYMKDGKRGKGTNGCG